VRRRRYVRPGRSYEQLDTYDWPSGSGTPETCRWHRTSTSVCRAIVSGVRTSRFRARGRRSRRCWKRARSRRSRGSGGGGEDRLRITRAGQVGAGEDPSRAGARRTQGPLLRLRVGWRRVGASAGADVAVATDRACRKNRRDVGPPGFAASPSCGSPGGRLVPCGTIRAVDQQFRAGFDGSP